MRTPPSLKIVSAAALLVAIAGACTGAGRRDPETSDKPPIATAPTATIAEDDRPPDGEEWGIVGDPNYASVVRKVVGMVEDRDVVAGAQRRGLSVMNVTWEDTGRLQGSAVGPNISDLTLQVRFRESDGGGGEAERGALMPVFRFPNFSDRTGDVKADKFLIRVGNQRNKAKLESVPLGDVLRNIKKYAAKPWSIEGTGNLLARRDTHFLVSAQAVFLPIPKQGKAEFNPVVFNYQSAPGSPAVLTLLVTRQGTSMTVVENAPEESSVQGFGQELYFNNEGQRASFTAERKSDVEKRIAASGGPRSADERSALARGADVLFLVQVPLKHRQRGYLGGAMNEAAGMAAPQAPPPASAAAPGSADKKAAEKSDVEQAVLGHGKNRGPFEEGRGLRLERDERFPIRITVQFYKATSNGVVDERDLDAIASTIGSVYEHADFVGSLVIPAGDPRRPTSWQKIPNEWFPW